MNSKISGIIIAGFHTEGGGGAWDLHPPPRIPKVVTVLLINKLVYSRHSNRSNNIKIYSEVCTSKHNKITVKYDDSSL